MAIKQALKVAVLVGFIWCVIKVHECPSKFEHAIHPGDSSCWLVYIGETVEVAVVAYLLFRKK